MNSNSALHLQSLLTALDDIIFEINGNLIFNHVWVRDEAILFMPKDQFLGRDMAEVMGPLTPILTTAVKEAIATGNPQELIYPHLDPQVDKWYKVTIRPVIKSQNLPDYILILTVKDITERKQIEKDNLEKTTLLEGLLHNLPVVVFKLKKDSTVLSAIGSGLSSLDVNSEGLVGKKAIELFPSAESGLQKAASGQRTRFVTMVNNKDAERYFDCIIFPDVDEEQENMIGFAIDITQSKLAEKEIEKNHSELKQLSVDLANLNEFKDKILAIISHDIRSPLNSLTGLISIPHVFSAEYEESAIKNMIIEQLNSVNTMVNDLLGWATISFKETTNTVETLSINELLQHNIVLLQELANRKKVRISNHIVPETKVIGNRGQVNVVLRNLLTNAIKFTPLNGEIMLTSTLEDPYALISISDSGIGMSTEQLQNLFTPKHQSTYGTNGEKGIGIGLLLSKEYIERNGGQISVSSEVNKGSVFTVKLKTNA